jgi:CHRD domain/PEP-CTERM motif
MKKLLPAVIIACSLMSANATIFQYEVTLDGPSESPPNASPGTGFGTVDFDNVLNTLTLSITFSGLLGTTTASHIHAATASPFTGTAGVATTTPSFSGFPLGVTAGAFSSVLDLTQASSYNPAYVTANGGTTASAEAALAAAMASGQAYWNIHTTVVPGGEIRGFLIAVPEPSSLALLGLGAIALIARAGSKQRATNT